MCWHYFSRKPTQHRSQLTECGHLISGLYNTLYNSCTSLKSFLLLKILFFSSGVFTAITEIWRYKSYFYKLTYNSLHSFVILIHVCRHFCHYFSVLIFYVASSVGRWRLHCLSHWQSSDFVFQRKHPSVSTTPDLFASLNQSDTWAAEPGCYLKFQLNSTWRFWNFSHNLKLVLVWSPPPPEGNVCLFIC